MPRRAPVVPRRAPATSVSARVQDDPELMRGTSVRPCSKCSTAFALSDGEISFYRAKRFAMPMTCAACRRGGSTAAMRKRKAAQAVAMAEEKGHSLNQQQQVAKLDNRQIWRE